MFAYTESVEEDELQYLLNYLFSQDWLKLTAHETHTQNMNVIITVKGYSRLAELETVVVASFQAFRGHRETVEACITKQVLRVVEASP